ncbi:hypothetical protein [Alkalicoccus luteus]|uniref:Uncharacterized protein n=1 Tax=Alkalicoccus luteus TaxID=1237094 RepID=A0A969TWB0_9BACI|nr:hypothetical protein [Alkalicoccus luteus]NJP39265.1 hypothetical protein [Alkalicoccus luteus]
MPKLLSVSELITETFGYIKQPGWWAPTFLALIAVSLPVWIFLLISDQPFLYGEGRELSLGELNQTGGANDHPFRGGGDTAGPSGTNLLFRSHTRDLCLPFIKTAIP